MTFQLAEYLEQPLRHAEDWKSQHPGSKLIGCFPVYTPFPVIEAAGALPVRMFGGGTTLEIDHADSRIQSFVCSIARSTLEQGLTGRLKSMDGMVFPSICDVSKNLSGVWKRNFPDMFVEYLHLPQNLESQSSRTYFFHELERFKENLEKFTDRTITDQCLNMTIRDGNENLYLIEKLYSLRAQKPALLSTVDLYSLLRSGAVLTRAEHNRLLEEALQELKRKPELKQRDSIRVIVEGAFCEQPPLELLSVLENAGCYIVDDDFMKGFRWFRSPVAVDGNPLRSLAEHYLNQGAPVAVRHCGEERWKDIGERVGKYNADGVIFCSAKFCEPSMFDYVLLRDELEKRKIPSLYLEFEEKMTVFDTVRTQVETFVESILFFE